MGKMMQRGLIRLLEGIHESGNNIEHIAVAIEVCQDLDIEIVSITSRDEALENTILCKLDGRLVRGRSSESWSQAGLHLFGSIVYRLSQDSELVTLPQKLEDNYFLSHTSKTVDYHDIKWHLLQSIGIKKLSVMIQPDEFPEITSVDLAIAAALDEGFMSMKGARMMAKEIQDLRALLCRASRIMSVRAASQAEAEKLWRKDLNKKVLA